MDILPDDVLIKIFRLANPEDVVLRFSHVYVTIFLATTLFS